MLTFEALDLLSIRARVMAATAGNLGTYLVPGQPNQPAIRVLDRPLDPGIKVDTAGLTEVARPALEVVINPVATYSDLGGNFNQSYQDEVYTIYLIWHDQRQYQRQALVTLMAAFKGYNPKAVSIGASELHKQQHIFTIQNKIMVAINA